MKTVDALMEELGLWVEDIALKTNLSEQRIEAITLGRWTPSPSERAQIARVLAVDVEEVSWGHSMDPRNIRYRRFGLKEDF